MQFISKAFIRLLAGIVTVQSLAWVLGVMDETYEFVKNNRGPVLIFILFYLVLYYILYDPTLDAEQIRYQNRMKGASLRSATKKFVPGVRRNRRKTDKSSK